MAVSYKDSGVDVEKGYKAVELMKKHVKATYNSNVLGDLGSFGGFYSIANEQLKEPILVAGCDGVGTKLKYAFIADRHNTIGIDCVAMCVNDIACQGAKPLFFLDYFATGKLSPETVATVVSGIADGCKLSKCALIGGETAEMPGFYPDGEYDLAGFAVGIVSKEKVINGQNITEGDVLLGLKSSGIHSNGYSLVRKLFGEDKTELNKFDKTLNSTIIDALLTPTRIYVESILKLNEIMTIKGVAHITGGGFFENIPRIFPNDIGCEINLKSYELPAIFKIMQEKAEISNQQIYNTFNMGIGMVVAVDKNDVEKAIKQLESTGEKVVILGETVKGNGVKLI
jgi:phosphoribosylformylglycinamidine cyclo-ligase